MFTYLVWIYIAGACPKLHGVYKDPDHAELVRHEVGGSIEIRKVEFPFDLEVSEK